MSSIKKVFLKISQYSQENTCAEVFFTKLQTFGPGTLLKRYSKIDIFCEYCKIFKNTYFEVYLRTAASVL